MARKKTARRKTTSRKKAGSKAAGKRTGQQTTRRTMTGAKKKSAKKTATGTPRTAAQQTWVVTTSGDRPMAEVAKDLSAAGFVVDQTLDQIGVITGRSTEKAVGKARSVRGVTDVSPEPKIDIGPPNSHDTW
jgi:hypothetical protein